MGWLLLIYVRNLRDFAWCGCCLTVALSWFPCLRPRGPVYCGLNTAIPEPKWRLKQARFPNMKWLIENESICSMVFYRVHDTHRFRVSFVNKSWEPWPTALLWLTSVRFMWLDVENKHCCIIVTLYERLGVSNHRFSVQKLVQAYNKEISKVYNCEGGVMMSSCVEIGTRSSITKITFPSSHILDWNCK